MLSLTRLIAVMVLAAAAPLPGSAYSRTVYISSSTGSDTNPGTKSRPLASLAALTPQMRTDSRIRLKRGDCFFGPLTGLSGCDVGAYGTGDAPIISGFRILAPRPDAWTETSPGLWQLDLTADSLFTGMARSSQLIPNNFDNIGCLYVIGTDTIIGHLVRSETELRSPADFFTSARPVPSRTPLSANTLGRLLLRSDVNPAAIGTLALSTANHGLYDLGSCTVHDIAVMGFGCHGACGIRSTTIRDCVFDIIGGCIQPDTDTWVRYGNGVEVWDNRRDILVTGCTFSRVYDCATTIQGSAGADRPAVNVRFVANKMRYCRQAYEYFLRDNDRPAYPGCEFADNVCYRMGVNDFDSPEWRDADLLWWSDSTVTMTIRDNIFFGASYTSGPGVNPGLRDNTVYLYPGQFINNFWTRGYRWLRVSPADFEQMLQAYRDRFGDNSRIILLTPGSPESLDIEARILRRIAWRTPRLP